MKVEVKDLPEIPVAYIRHTGPYKGDEELFGRMFAKLMEWAGPKGLLQSPDTKVMVVYHDNPAMVEESKLRMDACVTVPDETEVEGEIRKMTIPAGKYAIAHFEITADQYEGAWRSVYEEWLPESGYQVDYRPCFELFLNDPKQHPEGKHIVNICVPVKLA